MESDYVFVTRRQGNKHWTDEPVWKIYGAVGLARGQAKIAAKRHKEPVKLYRIPVEMLEEIGEY